MAEHMIRPAALPGMSAEEFYDLFLDEKRWYGCDAETQMAIAQELENRQAARDGRSPIQVKLMTDPKAIKTCCGIHMNTWNGAVLLVNPHYFDRAHAAFYPPAGLMDTILHEGRHNLQHVALRLTRQGKFEMNREVFLRWDLENRFYVNDGRNALYWTQFIEIDARFSALKEMARMRDELIAKGMNATYIDLAIRQSIHAELRHIDMVYKQLTPEKLEEIEKEQKMLYKQRFHTELPEDMTVYFFTHFILDNKGMDKGKILECMMNFREVMCGELAFNDLKQQFSFMDIRALEKQYRLLAGPAALEKAQRRIRLT